ncbi:HEAT repeat domain-containing protein [Aerosakkonemataceae cyanobacterium BLCC-F154]|uniref:HEAT repeat domain-containing protein n=1 Tax=Floridaenema fluviatile BLCC-F154 TaxID=3153640 RepID=A0ABV4YD83_9CYAN
MSEFSDIQPASQSGRLSQPISVENGRDLAVNFRNAPYEGQKVEVFFAFAENQPEKAVPAFAEILETKASPPMRALALQGLGISAQKDVRIKRALASCETDEDLQVLRDVAKEVKGKGEVSSDLTRWAGAWAIETIGFSPDAIEHLEGGALTDPPYRIRNEIINRKLQEINRIQEKDSRGELTSEYERNLEFWLYGPTHELFRESSNSSKYEDLVRKVIYQLHVRGIELAVDKDQRLKIDNPQKRRWLQEAALRIAAGKFKDSESTEAEQRRLFDNLGHFLDNHFNQDIPLRKLAAEAIRNAGYWLSDSIRARALILCEQWQQAANIGEAAVSHLEEVIDRELRLSTDENEIINQQIKAVEAIYRIQFFELSQKLKIVAKFLLRPEEKVRNTATRLLKQHKSILDREATNLLEALLFEYKLDQPDPKDLTIAEIESIISSSNSYYNLILNKFGTAIAAVDTLKTVYQKSDSSIREVKEFINYEMKKYLSIILKWIEKLSEQKLETEKGQSKIISNQSILRKVVSFIKDVNYKLFTKLKENPNYNSQESTNYQTYKKCQTLYGELVLLKKDILANLENLRYQLASKCQMAGKISLITIGIGFSLILITYIVSPPLSQWYQYNSPTPSWFLGASYNPVNTYNSTNTTAWYTTGFPKNSCGSSYSRNKCWYPVFINYSESNWNGLKSNHCRDISQGRGKTTARDKGEIQVASFSSLEEAQGFANYMRGQYGSGRVGEKKCY